MHYSGHVAAAENSVTRATLREGPFRHLSPASLEAFWSVSYPRIYPEGVVLFAEGETPRTVDLLGRGRVKLSFTSKDGKELILNVAGPGALLGLSAVVSGLPCEVPAEALEPCLTSCVSKKDFLEFLKAHGDACLLVARHLSCNNQRACDRIRSLCLANSAAEKLAKLLLDWCEVSGRETKHGFRLKVTCTHTEMARMIGISRETVTRPLARFKGKGIVCWEDSTLTVRDRAALEKVAGP